MMMVMTLFLCLNANFSHFFVQVFGLFNTIAYAAGTYFLYLEHKGGATP